MKIRSSEIEVSAIRKEQYPKEGLPEIALVEEIKCREIFCYKCIIKQKKFC